MALEMLASKIAVIPLDDPSKFKSLDLSGGREQRVDQGIVKYRGPLTEESEGGQGIKVGDHVVFSGYTGTKIAVEDEGTLYIMEDDDVIALMNDDEAVPVVPLPKILELLETTKAKAWLKYHGDPPVEAYYEMLRSAFEDSFFKEGLEF